MIITKTIVTNINVTINGYDVVGINKRTMVVDFVNDAGVVSSIQLDKNQWNNFIHFELLRYHADWVEEMYPGYIKRAKELEKHFKLKLLCHSYDD